MHRSWDRLVSFIRGKTPKTERLVLVSMGLFFAAQIAADIFGGHPTILTSSWSDFGQSMVVLGVINGLAVLIGSFMLGLFGTVISFAYNFLAEAPPLFGYRADPPAIDNEALIRSFTKERQEIIGRVEPLDAQEISALAAHLDTQTIPTELQAPLSGKTCLAFRLVGESRGQLIDDADAVFFALVTDDNKRCVVTSSDAVVLLPAEHEIESRGEIAFLQERGLPATGVSLREAVLKAGDRARIVGRRSELHIGSAGYRGGGERRTMIDAGDGLPVVIADA